MSYLKSSLYAHSFAHLLLAGWHWYKFDRSYTWLSVLIAVITLVVAFVLGAVFNV